jgi:hypothetical protein
VNGTDGEVMEFGCATDETEDCGRSESMREGDHGKDGKCANREEGRSNECMRVVASAEENSGRDWGEVTESGFGKGSGERRTAGL